MLNKVDAVSLDPVYSEIHPNKYLHRLFSCPRFVRRGFSTPRHPVITGFQEILTVSLHSYLQCWNFPSVKISVPSNSMK
jgi:hypothetical protein